MINSKKEQAKRASRESQLRCLSAITAFIHSDRASSNEKSHSSARSLLQMEQLPTPFTMLFASQMLNALNSIIKAEQFNGSSSQTIYSAMLYPRITDQSQNEHFEISMGCQLGEMLSQNTQRHSNKKMMKSKTFFKKNSYQKDPNSSKSQIKSVSLTNDAMSWDEMFYKDRDGIDSVTFEVKSMDMSNKNTNKTISPIKEEDHLNKGKVSKAALLKEQFSRMTLLNQKSKLRKDYSAKVRLANMLESPKKTMKQAHKDHYIKRYMNAYEGNGNDFNNHDYSLLNYLFENVTAFRYDKNSFKRGQVKRMDEEAKKDFKLNLVSLTESSLPKTNKSKSRGVLLRKSEEKPLKISHQYQNTQANPMKFIDLYDKYIDYDKSYHKKIIHHKKVYSQQYPSTHRDLLEINLYNSKDMKTIQYKSTKNVNNDLSRITKTKTSEEQTDHNTIQSHHQPIRSCNIKPSIIFSISKKNVVEYSHLKPRLIEH